ncbi:MAG: helix-turn-helix transcriptional regulator [Patescibacteria group bacterium]
MEFKPTFIKDGPYYLAEIKEIDAMTQGRTKKEAELMVKDLLETMFLAYFDEKIKVKTATDQLGDLILIAEDRLAIPLILRCLRTASQKTIEEVSHACGFKSKNAYAQYEQGRRMPGIEQFSKLLEILGAQLRVNRIHETR